MSKKNKNEIVVSGQKIQTRIEEIDIFKLKYWKDNPRVNAIIKQNFGNKDVSDNDIEKLLWDKVDSVRVLKEGIEQHGGLIDEILVRDNIVLEGNSRLCAYRHLYKKAETKHDEEEMLKWSYIRAKIIPKDTSEKIVFTILGTWHIKGKTQWDTYEKAAYLKRMNTDHNYSLKEIADLISQTETFVKNHITTYDLMVENEILTLQKFSYFNELVKNKSIKTIALKDPSIITRTIKAIKEDRFKKAEEIRNVSKVWNDKKAKKEFFEENNEFEDAFGTSKGRHPEHENSFLNQIKKVTKALQNCSVKGIEDIKVDGNKKYILNELYKEVKHFCKKVGIKN